MSAKPLGYFRYCLACDCETSGLAFGQIDPTLEENTGVTYQAVSFAFIVVDTETLEEVDELYVEIKWNGESKWTSEAEKIHGLSKAYLEKNGLDEKDAVCEIAEFILKYFDPNKNIPLLGHNVVSFDRYFLFHLFNKFGLNLQFGSRHIDTLPIGFTLFNLFHSDQIFDKFGLEKRTQHNALQDIRQTLKVIQMARALWEAYVIPELEKI